MRISSTLLPVVILALSACGSGDAPSGGLSPDQNATLEKSAQKLDAQRADLPKRGVESDADTTQSPASSDQ